MQEITIDPELMLRIIREDRNAIAYDTETSGLSVKDHVAGYVITNDEYSIYAPVRHKAGGNIPKAEDFEKALAGAFADRSRARFLTVGHNLGFDLRASLRQGIVLWHPLEDTMINEALIDDRTVGYGLDDCAVRRGVTAKKGSEIYQLLADRFGGLPDRKQMAHFHEVEGDNPLAIDYAAGDGITTLELWAKQQPLLDEELSGKSLRPVHDLECRLLPYLARIHNRGIKVDMGYAEMLLREDNPDGLPAKIREAKEQFAPGFNARSANDVLELFLANGYTDADFPKTPTGKPSFREDWLDQSELGEAVLGVRRLEKLHDSFYTPLVETNNVNGRVHPILNQSKSDDYGVAGARLSCSEPNMQAFPKRNAVVGKLVRPLIIPDFGKIYEMDFSQQEPRLFTHYAKEPVLLQGYRDGTTDIHDRSNDLLFGGKDRDKAKRLGMGMLTMLGETALATKLKVPRSEAKALKRAFLYDAYPTIRVFQDDVIATFAARGYVFSIMGRRAYLESQRFAYQGVSRVIQNSGGDHTKTALLMACEFEDAHPEIQMLMTIHDSFISQTENVAMAKELQAVLESAAPKLNLTLPIPVDVGFGDNWSEASYIKRGKDWYAKVTDQN